MTKHNQSRSFNIRKLYIFTGPMRVSDMNDEDENLDDDYDWLEKSRRLQARRWRKIKHQLV